jgi:hypothetical protein
MHFSEFRWSVTARRRTWRSCLTTLVLLAGVSSSRAQSPRTFSLNLVRAPGAEACVSGHQLATRLEGWIGPVFAAAGRADHAIEALLSRADGAGWRARVVVSDAHGDTLGERELRTGNHSCRGLDPQLLLVIALAIDPEVALAGLPDELLNEFSAEDDPAADLLRELERASAQAEAARTAAADSSAGMAGAAHDGGDPEGGRDQARPPSPRSPGPAAAWSWQLEAQLLSSVGLMPSLAFGPGLELSMDPRGFWPLMLSAAVWLPNQAELARPTARGDSVAFTMLQFGVGLCPSLLGWGSLQVRMCGGMLVANRRADSDALESTVQVSRWSWGPFLGPRATHAMNRSLSLVAGASVHAPFNRDTFAYDDQFGTKQYLFRPAAVAVFAEVGIALGL